MVVKSLHLAQRLGHLYLRRQLGDPRLRRPGPVQGSVEQPVPVESHLASVQQHRLAHRLWRPDLFVPIASGEEVVGTGQAGYSCCTFRRIAVAALDARTGQVQWKHTSMIDEPLHPTHKNKGDGVMMQLTGPAGAAIWSAPTVDAKRRGPWSMSRPATAIPELDAPTGADAIVALDMKTGKIRWVSFQVTKGDNYLTSCGQLGHAPHAQLSRSQRAGLRLRRLAHPAHPAKRQAGRPVRARSRASPMAWTPTPASFCGRPRSARAPTSAASNGASPPTIGPGLCAQFRHHHPDGRVPAPAGSQDQRPEKAGTVAPVGPHRRSIPPAATSSGTPRRR